MRTVLQVLLASALAVASAAPFTYPPTFGLSNLGSCSGAPGCGSAMTSIDGVPAYSNGGDQCTGNCCGGDISTGCAYQCVELAQRFFHVQHGTPADWGVPFAKDLCGSHPGGVSQTSNPGHGDLVVFGWQPYGHVAVVDSISGGTVNVVEQNASPSGRNSYPTSQASCFLTYSGAAASKGLVLPKKIEEAAKSALLASLAARQNETLGAIPCTLCEDAVGFLEGKIASVGCGFAFDALALSACEAAGLGPEDPLSEACAAALIEGCSMIVKLVEQHVTSTYHICSAIHLCSGSGNDDGGGGGGSTDDGGGGGGSTDDGGGGGGSTDDGGGGGGGSTDDGGGGGGGSTDDGGGGGGSTDDANGVAARSLRGV